MESWKAREEICEVGRRLWQRGLVAGGDGNISVRVGEDRLLCTPSGECKGFLRPDDLVVMALDGRVLDGRRPSSEIRMHLEIYRARNDARAVVHAHPPYATAFSVSGIPLDRCVLPEAILTMGAVPIAPYGTPSTEEVPEAIRGLVERCDALLLENHGAVTLGDSLRAAHFRMENLEHTAAVIHHAIQLGSVRVLTAAEADKLRAVRERMGIAGRALPCESAGMCLRERPFAKPAAGEAEVVEAATRAVLGMLAPKTGR
jgi:L-fuculose-phosphate aldolase